MYIQQNEENQKHVLLFTMMHLALSWYVHCFIDARYSSSIGFNDKFMIQLVDGFISFRFICNCYSFISVVDMSHVACRIDNCLNKRCNDYIRPMLVELSMGTEKIVFMVWCNMYVWWCLLHGQSIVLCAKIH